MSQHIDILHVIYVEYSNLRLFFFYHTGEENLHIYWHKNYHGDISISLNMKTSLLSWESRNVKDLKNKAETIRYLEIK